ncbi:MAG: DUF1566 domain-containing protein [Sulfuricella sp.]|nr:DUF1566 domain-containing protein [Sulfuricella sp.]
MKPDLFHLFRRLPALLAVVFLLANPPVQAATTPTADFTDNGDGTVTHKITGLTWKRCTEGMTWTGSTCVGTAKTYTWIQANALSSSGGWRLPTIAELVTIVERDNVSPAINTTIFPATTPSYFWSASAYAGSSVNAWYVYFYSGDDDLDSYRSGNYVRLVRGGQSLDSLWLYTPTSDFSDNGDGTVTHQKTSLTWKRCAEGQTWSGSTCSGTAKSYTWSAANALSTGGWRLPTVNELQTLVEYSIAYPGPAINTTIFPSTPASEFWSASAYANSSDGAWYVDLLYGGDSHYTYGNTNNNNVRLVRGGQSVGASSTPVNSPPSAPIFLSTPSSALVNVAIDITVQAGVAPKGAQVNANCSATNSDHPGSASASLSGLGRGGRSVQHSFTFYATGTQSIYCTSFDASGNASATASKTITVAAQAATTPTADFTDNGDGTVTHKITGLTWKRCAEGMTWTGSTCVGMAKTYTWAQANALSTGGGWRLPTIAELVTIVERDNVSPAINATIFPATTVSYFWSASAYAGNSDNTWNVLFGNGNDNPIYKMGYWYVRLVRGGQSLGSSGLYTPTSDFSDNGDGTVTHQKTGLTWKRCAEGQTWSGSTCSGTAKSYTWSAANALSTGGWRLPTVNELQTLVEYSIAYPGPTINTTIFPSTPASCFWSVSAYAGSSDDTWYVDFGNGNDRSRFRTSSFYVRLVRGGQSAGASSTTPTTTATTDADRVFNWAESVYPKFFAPAKATTKNLFGYTYRYYSGTNSYLGVKDGYLYYMDMLSGTQLLDVGMIADYLPKAQAAGF